MTSSSTEPAFARTHKKLNVFYNW